MSSGYNYCRCCGTYLSSRVRCPLPWCPSHSPSSSLPKPVSTLDQIERRDEMEPLGNPLDYNDMARCDRRDLLAMLVKAEIERDAAWNDAILAAARTAEQVCREDPTNGITALDASHRIRNLLKK